jgi:hypothetical protein
MTGTMSAEQPSMYDVDGTKFDWNGLAGIPDVQKQIIYDSQLDRKTEISLRNYRSLPETLIPNKFLEQSDCVLPAWQSTWTLSSMATISKFEVEQHRKGIKTHGCTPLTITFSDKVDKQWQGFDRYFPPTGRMTFQNAKWKPHQKELWLDAVCQSSNIEQKWEKVHKIPYSVFCNMFAR